jgi:hypothetical protein
MGEVTPNFEDTLKNLKEEALKVEFFVKEQPEPENLKGNLEKTNETAKNTFKKRESSPPRGPKRPGTRKQIEQKASSEKTPLLAPTNHKIESQSAYYRPREFSLLFLLQAASILSIASIETSEILQFSEDWRKEGTVIKTFLWINVSIESLYIVLTILHVIAVYTSYPKKVNLVRFNFEYDVERKNSQLEKCEAMLSSVRDSERNYLVFQRRFLLFENILIFILLLLHLIDLVYFRQSNFYLVPRKSETSYLLLDLFLKAVPLFINFGLLSLANLDYDNFFRDLKFIEV